MLVMCSDDLDGMNRSSTPNPHKNLFCIENPHQAGFILKSADLDETPRFEIKTIA